MSKKRRKNNIKALIYLLLLPILIIIVIIKLILKIYKSIKYHNKNEGEEIVKNILGENDYYNDVFVINDYRTYNENKSVQIDHILITTSQILCIETKHYNNCKIYGGANSLDWKIYYGKEKHELYNPIKQNESHIKTIKKIINKNIPIINIVVFTGTANIDKINYKEIYDKNKFKKLIADIKKSKGEYDSFAIHTKLSNKYISISDNEHIKNIQKYK